MASHYGFKAMVPGAQLSIPAAQTFLERSEVSKVIGSVEQGDGDAKPIMVPMGMVLWWVSAEASK